MDFLHNKFNLMLRIAALTLAAVFMACFFTGCDAKTKIVVAGSTSVQPYAELLAEEFMHSQTGIKINVQGGGSSAGIEAAIEGVAAIGMSSRDLNENEKDKLAWYKEIALDGLAIIIHPDNPIIKKSGNPNHTVDFTYEQLRDIYSGKITDWSKLGGSSGEIYLITREEGSGTRDAFEKLAMDGNRISPRAMVQNSNGGVRLQVSGNKNSIGFISMGFVELEGKRQKPVRAVSIEKVSATIENVLNGDYTLARSFWFVSKDEPEGIVKEFIDFVLSEEGKKVLSGAGLVVTVEEDS